MTVEEYKARLVEIDKEANYKKYQTRLSYALEHKKYDIGDILQTKEYQAVVRKIKLAMMMYSTSLPECEYVCDRLTKKGTVNKNDPVCYVFDSEKEVTLVGHVNEDDVA